MMSMMSSTSGILGDSCGGIVGWWLERYDLISVWEGELGSRRQIPPQKSDTNCDIISGLLVGGDVSDGLSEVSLGRRDELSSLISSNKV